jgi:hypothetical protein
VAEQYEVRMFPHVFALDEAGIIRARGGVMNIAYLRGLLQAAYGESVYGSDSVQPNSQVLPQDGSGSPAVV